MYKLLERSFSVTDGSLFPHKASGLADASSQQDTESLSCCN